MKKSILAVFVIMTAMIQLSTAQQGNDGAKDTAWKKVYRETAPVINDLVHTKIDAKFDYDKSYMYGKVWLTIKPHFYATDSLKLDAKGMNINKVALVKGTAMQPLKYEYDGWELKIKLDKSYTRFQNYIIYIDYTAKPDEVKVKGSAAINDAKGLYFINPKGEEKDKPTQIWTQGETEATSVWCPTIDKPNQKTTQETAMTVPGKYVTLSNGKLISQKKNTDGTRTDTWKMELPHSPYLFFMGIGDYAVIKDAYKGKEVSYYVEKEYAPVARKIFGYTPEMIAFYSRITGVDYPWVKYAQITARDYVSGAMENTTATLHQESAQQDARELIDGNIWESTIAHELFHQWFGDYVTTESWSNITLNESFANYSETLWDEYKHGKDAGDAQNFSDMQGYLQSGSEKKDLVRFHYSDKEDVFDAVSYNKGGRILHMLRNYLGDSAFFKGLNNYLTTNKFKSAEAHQLRLAFEEVSGRDLNWYFDQWYFGDGHPKLSIDYNYDDAAKKVTVTVKQTQAGDKVFRLPVAIDIYTGAAKERYKIWVENKTDSFVFNYSAKPDLVNFDGDKILLTDKKDNKSLENFIHQYKYAGLYLDRREAIDAAAKKQDDPAALNLLKTAMKDKYFGLRNYTLGKLDMKKENVKKEVEPILLDLAKTDERSVVRARALSLMSNYNKEAYKEMFIKALTDSSYSVAGNALEALGKVDEKMAFEKAQQLSKLPAKGKLQQEINGSIIKYGDESAFDVVAANYNKMPLSQAKFEATGPFGQFLAKVKDTEKLQKGVDAIIAFREAIPENFREQTDPFINGSVLKTLLSKKEEALKNAPADAPVLQQQIDYIKTKLEKKGF
jgi:aminopeptidase N